MSLKKEITLYLQTSWNVEQAERAAYILSLIRERIRGIENPFSDFQVEPSGRLHHPNFHIFEQARQSILKELE